MSQTLIKISVGELVAFALKTGDLGSPFLSTSRAVEGTRGHQLVQRSRPPEYEPEVPITFIHDVEPVGLQISGRIDGVLFDDQGALLIEEIKTTYGSVDFRRDDNPVHWAQALLYGHFMAVKHNLDQVDIQLTYVQIGSGALREDRRTFTLLELEQRFEKIIAAYLRWMTIYTQWCERRDHSIEQLRFPFPSYRDGQEELIEAVTETIESQGRLYVQAPTGIGKTISVLYPAVVAIGEKQTEKIFYLTAKTSGRAIAEKACDDMRATGLEIKSITLTARDRICFNASGGKPCDTDSCEFAIGYYDRIDAALEDLFQRDSLTRTTIEEIARQHQVCPFELSLDTSLWADIIICDYNYVFDPKAYLRRYFLDRSGAYTLLIDEAHNLVDRARDMYSAELRKRDVLHLKEALATERPQLARVLDRIHTYMLVQIERCDSEGNGEAWFDCQPPEELAPPLMTFLELAEPILSRQVSAPYSEALRDFYFAVFSFLRVLDLFDERFTTYGEKSGRDLRLRLFCLDPSALIRQALKRGKSATFFSATLTPTDYFRILLGGERTDYTLELPSPFPKEHVAVIVDDHIDTTYRKRSLSYDDVAAAIAAFSDRRQGNYIAYFPSYQYMDEVCKRFRAAYPAVDVQVQARGMKEEQREQFLTLFDGGNRRTVVGFAVLGGLFGEGIDLVGERLVGAAIVGVGLPQICFERDLIRAYYDEKEMPGFAYAYSFPGMNRVLQAAGRVIRSAADRGLILLLDRRFAQEQYGELMPPHWNRRARTGSPEEISQAVADFWAMG
jgi:DNA excision repair protein ERCC-2